MTRYAILAAAIALTPVAALAETIELDRPMQAASLHEGAIDMVVYYLEHDDHFEVVATYATKSEPGEPNRIRMGLKNGDSTEFSLPGQRHVSYAFDRDGDRVSITAEPTARKFAQLAE